MMNQLKKVGALFISHSLSLSLSLSHISLTFAIFFTSHTSLLQARRWMALGLMDIVEPVDDVEEREDGGEDHPGPLIDWVHVGQVWDVHLQLRGPSP